jgi:hypothetical protein
VGIAPVAVEDTEEAEQAEQDGAHDMVGTAATVAGVFEWAFARKFFPSPASLEELEKEDQLALAGDGCAIIPLGMKASAGSVHRPSPRRCSRGVFGCKRPKIHPLSILR